jgi:hypothetical protein
MPRYCFSMLVSTLIGLCFSLHATDLSSEEQLTSLIQNEKFREMGKYLKKQLGKELTFSKARQIAIDLRCSTLDTALQTAHKMASLANDQQAIGCFAESALFIENELSSFIAKKTYYLPSLKTSLSHSIEYDPITKKCFLILKGKQFLLGVGAKKKVTKAILYDTKRPEIVARAEQNRPMEREFAITKLVKGYAGILATKAFTQHYRRGKKCTTVYSKIYNAGSLQDVFDKKIHLSLHEKMKVVLDLLKGLEVLHAQYIAHRDLGARNLLVHIPKGATNPRNVQAVLADLGRAKHVFEIKDEKANGNTSYIPPEGLFVKKIVGRKCFKADIFAVGNVFYELFYGKPAPWRKARYFKDRDKSAKTKYKNYTKQLTTLTQARRKVLSLKMTNNTLSPRDEFEALILNMVHANPNRRSSAKSLKEKMQSIFDKQSGKVQKASNIVNPVDLQPDSKNIM